MRKAHRYTVNLMTAALFAALGSPAFAQSLPDAVKLLGADTTKSIEFSGNGRWFQFGQAPAPSLPWPPFAVSKYVADINYETVGARVQIVRQQIEEPGRRRPAPSPQWADQYVKDKSAWNLPQPHLPQNPASQPAAVEERLAEIWATPQGFLRAAQANNAATRKVKEGLEVSFTLDGKYRYVGLINARNQVETVQTWIDNPVLGDTLVETRFSGYKDFGGVQFPVRLVRNEGGHPILDLTINEVKLNPAVNITVPDTVAKAAPTPVKVVSTQLAEGVFYLTGGTHHSVAIVQKDHVVLVEAPLNEERSLALIEKLKEIAPGKPVKYLVNTHAHFDHSGGLRTFVDAGAIIVTPKANQAYYQKIWANHHGLNPDLLEKSGKTAKFETFTGKHVISDGSRSVEIYPIAASAHNDAFALVYLPAEKILVEADAFTPTAANAPLPASPNPYSVNLYENVLKLKLDVKQIAALHGPRVTTLDDLRAAIGQVAVQ